MGTGRGFYVLLMDNTSSRTRQLRISERGFKVSTSLLAVTLFATLLFFCDYIHTKKEDLQVDRLRVEAQTLGAHVRFFSSRVEAIERQVSILKEFDRKIRLMANLERSPDMMPLIGVGGFYRSQPDIRLKKQDEEKGGVDK